MYHLEVAHNPKMFSLIGWKRIQHCYLQLDFQQQKKFKMAGQACASVYKKPQCKNFLTTDEVLTALLDSDGLEAGIMQPRSMQEGSALCVVTKEQSDRKKNQQMHTKLLWKMSKIYLWELFSRLPYPKSIIKMFSILCLKVYYILCDIDYIISFQEYWALFLKLGKKTCLQILK